MLLPLLSPFLLTEKCLDKHCLVLKQPLLHVLPYDFSPYCKSLIRVHWGKHDRSKQHTDTKAAAIKEKGTFLTSMFKHPLSIMGAAVTITYITYI